MSLAKKSFTKSYSTLHNLVMMTMLMKLIIPVIESKTWSPIRGVKNRLNGTGEVCETVAHQEEPTNTNKKS